MPRATRKGARTVERRGQTGGLCCFSGGKPIYKVSNLERVQEALYANY
jgi:hypothetical protein